MVRWIQIVQGHDIKLNYTINPQEKEEQVRNREREGGRIDLSMQHLFNQSNNLIDNSKSIISLNTCANEIWIVQILFQAVLGLAGIRVDLILWIEMKWNERTDIV